MSQITGKVKRIGHKGGQTYVILENLPGTYIVTSFSNQDMYLTEVGDTVSFDQFGNQGLHMNFVNLELESHRESFAV